MQRMSGVCAPIQRGVAERGAFARGLAERCDGEAGELCLRQSERGGDVRGGAEKSPAERCGDPETRRLISSAIGHSRGLVVRYPHRLAALDNDCC